MLTTLNDALQERRLESQYVAMLFALWNDENRTLQVANSGAVQPIFAQWRDDNRARRRAPPGACSQTQRTRNSTGYPAWRRGHLHLRRHSGCRERAGKRCMVPNAGQSALRSPEKPAAVIADAIMADVTRFQGTRDRFDDETIIVLRVR